jgi:hypothetical protein
MSDGGGAHVSGGDEPDWDGLVLDAAFVQSAHIAEPSADELFEQAERRRRQEELRRRVESGEADHTIRNYRLAGDVVQLEPRRGRRGDRPARRHRLVWTALLLVIGLLFYQSITVTRSDRKPVATAEAGTNGGGGAPRTPYDDGAHAMPTFAPELTKSARGATWPPAPAVQSSAPLGQPAPLPAKTGEWAFLHKFPNGSPVAYDPCRPIHYVVNNRTAPPDAAAMVAEAIERISVATGLQFVNDGNTDETPNAERRAYLPDRYGPRWAPVLLSWTDPAEFPVLAGDVAGMGGSASVGYHAASGTDERLIYVSGIVAIDGPQVRRAQKVEGRKAVRTVLIHELAHLVGLAHVQDPTSIMTPTAGEITELGPGDLHGLHQLGQGACEPDI